METHFVLCGIYSVVYINACQGYCLCPESYPLFDLRNADANSTMTISFYTNSAEPGFEAVSSQYGYDDKCWRHDNRTGVLHIHVYASFPSPVCITGIQTWGYPNSSGYVSNYLLAYKTSTGISKCYLPMKQLLDAVEGNRDSTNGVYHKLPPKKLSYIYAAPKEFTVSPDWRWEVYGCVKRHNGRRCPGMSNEITLLAVDEMLPSVVMRYMRGGLQQLPPLVNALDLDKEAAQPTSLLSDDDRDTCLHPTGPCEAWHALIRIAVFPGDTPLRIVGRGIKCDSRHVLVTYQQNVTSSCRFPTRVCLLVSNGDCEAHCADNNEQVRDLAIYVRGDADARLCEVTSDSLVYML
ncbi:hypothetical protein CAPTEDRAFT_193624 [Capitella teleta]|uniref:Uncharacterized protein n=1 Tax=Capitella teleta TaxID=283909 RepID=R7VI36_CAPTE|nr:hypothetical protein CAPTEDRAFT_193624 [Capitella teleta]|eukprot:ELU15971.1 hypothetical protein CAPTEDRAFT_193624 [Capitella teleta]